MGATDKGLCFWFWMSDVKACVSHGNGSPEGEGTAQEKRTMKGAGLGSGGEVRGNRGGWVLARGRADSPTASGEKRKCAWAASGFNTGKMRFASSDS